MTGTANITTKEIKMIKLNETNTVFPGGRNYTKGSASTTPFTLRETTIGGHVVQVKVYESASPTTELYNDDVDYTVEADSISGIENNEH
jgi:hypothetical protein